MSEFLSIGFGIFAVLGAFGLVLFKLPANGAMSLVVSLLSIAGLFITLGSTILFLMQIVVYAGAIMVLIVFVIMFLNAQDDALIKKFDSSSLLWFASLPLLIVGIAASLQMDLAPTPTDLGGIKELGIEIFTKWIVPFELISVLLLVALVGVIAVTHKDKDAS